MIRFSHEANSWLVLDERSGMHPEDCVDGVWDYCTAHYARQMFDIGYLLWID